MSRNFCVVNERMQVEASLCKVKELQEKGLWGGALNLFQCNMCHSAFCQGTVLFVARAERES